MIYRIHIPEVTIDAVRCVPWAKNQARRLRMLNSRISANYIVNGVTVFINLLDDIATITLRGGPSGAYQFIGSLSHLYKTYEDDSSPAGSRYLPLVYAVYAELKGGAWKTTPLVSSGEEAPTDNPPTKIWDYDPDPRNTNNYLTISPAHQWDGMGVRQWFNPTIDNKKRNFPWIMTQWQQGLPLTGFGRFSSGSTARWFFGDMGYDIGPTYFGADNLHGLNKSPDSDWYGQAAIHRVDGRLFIIMSDINSVFYCYPISGYGDEIIAGGDDFPGEKANVPLALTQSQTCPWPAWVTVENLGEAAIAEPVPDADTHRSRLRTIWRFNQAGTRAACIAGHRDSAWSDAYFTSSIYQADGSFYEDCQEDYPGLVEVGFTVEVTGPGDGDFTFSVALLQDIYSKEDQRCPVDVGYALREINGIQLDSLIMLEYKHYTDCPSMAVIADDPDDPGPPTLYQLRRPNRATVASVQVQNGQGTWEEYDKWLAYYGCYPVKVGTAQEPRQFSPVITDFPGVPSGADGDDYLWNHFTYIGNLLSIDLSALAWNVGASIYTQGTVPHTSGETYVVEAAAIVTTVWGIEKSRKSIGHPILKDVAYSMYKLTHSYPDLSSMTQFHLNATAAYTHYTTGFASGNIHQYATLDVNDGAGNAWSNVIQDACENSWHWTPIQLNSTLFPSATDIWGPGIYALWDGWPIVRPGFRWEDSGGWKSGDISFSGYPYGAVHHGAIHFLTTLALNNVQQSIKVHRNGSWSIFSGPFAAQTEVITASVDVQNSFEQTIVDVVSIRNDNNDREYSTTHTELLNQAFSKSLTEEDYYFKLRKTGLGVPPEFQPNSDDPTGYDWYAIPGGPLGIIWPIQYFLGGIYGGTAIGRPFCEYSLWGDFISLHRYGSYTQFATFPNPRMECVFSV